MNIRANWSEPVGLEDDLLGIERQLWTNDADVYAASLTGDAVLVFAETGVIRRDTALAAIREENAEGRRWADVTFDDVLVTQPTRDTAVLTYRVTARWEHEHSATRALASTLYVRHNGGWKAAFHQQTPVR
jgi:hypothetical protein